MYSAKKFLPVLLLSILFFFPVISSTVEKEGDRCVPENITARSIIDQLLKTIEEVKTLKYNLKLFERINGKLLSTESVVKLQASPRKLYLYLKGPELLWIQ